MQKFLYLLMVLPFAVFPWRAEAQNSWQEVKDYAGIPVSSPQELSSGTVNCSKVSMPGEGLNIGTEANYLLPVTPDRAVELLRTNNSGAADEDHAVANPAVIDDFAKFSVTDVSLKNLGNLNLNAEEKQQLTAAFHDGSASAVNNAWRTLLLNRTLSFQQGGLVKASPYQLNDTTFQLAQQLVGMMKLRAPVLKRFVNSLDQAMTSHSPADSLPPVYYWETAKIQNTQNAALGAIFAVKFGNGYQVIDLTYYSASSYYLSLTLYEIWPVEINGKAQSYVWRGDYVLSSSLGYTKGIERMAAENIMLLEVKSTIRNQIKQSSGRSSS